LPAIRQLVQACDLAAVLADPFAIVR
jgi:hypothetical protein